MTSYEVEDFLQDVKHLASCGNYERISSLAYTCTSNSTLSGQNLTLLEQYWKLRPHLEGYSLLHLACKENFFEWSKHLLSNGMDAGKEAGDGKTPLVLAIPHKNWNLVKLLLDYMNGVRVSSNDLFGNRIIEKNKSNNTVPMIVTELQTNRFQTKCYGKNIHRKIASLLTLNNSQYVIDSAFVQVGKSISELKDISGNDFFFEIHVKEIEAMLKVLGSSGVTYCGLYKTLNEISRHPNIYGKCHDECRGFVSAMLLLRDLIITCIEYGHIKMPPSEKYSAYSILRVSVLTPLLFFNSFTKPSTFYRSGVDPLHIYKVYIDILCTVLLETSAYMTASDLKKTLNFLSQETNDGIVPFQEVINLILVSWPVSSVLNIVPQEHALIQQSLLEYDLLDEEKQNLMGKPYSNTYMECIKSHMESLPQRLDQLVRICLINNMKTPKKTNIQKLPIPQRLKKFLTYKVVMCF